MAVAVATAALAALRAARCPKREATHAAVVKTVLGQNISPGKTKKRERQLAMVQNQWWFPFWAGR